MPLRKLATLLTQRTSNLSNTLQPATMLLAVLSVLTLTIAPALTAHAASNSSYTFKDVSAANATNTVGKNWRAITMSSDGSKLAVVAFAGDIYTSSNSGQTWTNVSTTTATNTAGKYWSYIAMSSNGSKLAAVDGNAGDIYTSADSGATWTNVSATTATNTASKYWSSIAMSSDGTKLAAVENGNGQGGNIYISSDSGQTWTEISVGGKSWQSIAMSSDGTKLAAVENNNGNGGNIYTSADSGATWTNVSATTATNTAGKSWQTIAMSNDGTKLAAVAYFGGDIYTSADSGVTWTDASTTTATNTAGKDWTSITMSSDGTKLAAVEYAGDIYTSADSGITWTDISTTSATSTANKNWFSISMAPDGKLAAVNGNIWLGSLNTITAMLTSAPSTGSSTAPAPIELNVHVFTDITCSSTVTDTSLATQDSQYSYPLGLVNFCLSVASGSAQPIDLLFETDLNPADVTARKYNSVTKTYADVPNATITEETNNGTHYLRLTYTITDGGEQDEDGQDNGTILDPVGLAVITPVTPSTPNNPTPSANPSTPNPAAPNNPSSTSTSLAESGQDILLLVAAAVTLIGASLLAGSRLKLNPTSKK